MVKVDIPTKTMVKEMVDETVRKEMQLLSLSSWFCLIIGGIFLVTSFFQPQIFLGNIILNLKPTGIYIFVVGAFSLLIYYLSK